MFAANGRSDNILITFQVGLANVGKSTLFQAITKCSLGNPAVSDRDICNRPKLIASAELPFRDHRP